MCSWRFPIGDGSRATGSELELEMAHHWHRMGSRVIAVGGAPRQYSEMEKDKLVQGRMQVNTSI